MADDDVDVTLRLKAIDDSGRVLDDASRRAQAFLSQFNRNMKESTAATAALTTALKSTGQVVQGAASATAQHATAVGKHTAAMHEHAKASKAAEVATKGLEVAMGAAVTIGGPLVAALYSVDKAVEAVVEGYKKFAESQRGMDRIQLDTAATNMQMERLSKTIGSLSAVTGESGNALRETFSAFREQTELGMGEAIKTFDQVGRAALAAGVQTETMSRIAVAAIDNLKVPAGEVGEMLSNLVATVPSSMMGVFAQAMPRITQQLQGIGVHGKQAAEELAVAFSGIAVTMGGNVRQATEVTLSLFEKATDISNRVGRQTIPLIQQFVGSPDQISKTLEATYETVKDYFATDDLAEKSRLRMRYGMTDKELQSLDEYHKKQEENKKISEETGVAVDEVARRNARFAVGAQTNLDKMNESTGKLYDNMGKLLNATGISDTLTKMLEKLNNLTEKGAKIAEKAGYERTLRKYDEGIGTFEQAQAAKAGLKRMAGDEELAAAALSTDEKVGGAQAKLNLAKQIIDAEEQRKALEKLHKEQDEAKAKAKAEADAKKASEGPYAGWDTHPIDEKDSAAPMTYEEALKYGAEHGYKPESAKEKGDQHDARYKGYPSAS